jgi:LL-diaminopimelate aminotransferase
MGAALAGAEIQAFPLLAEKGFLPDLDAIPAEVADRADLLWLNYPNNPTGATADLEFFSQAVDYARRHGLLLCHDAPYCDIVYDGYVAPSLLQVPRAAEVAVEFNSLSKTYNMPGWRLGMAVGNAEALSLLGQVKSNMDSGIYGPLQEAAVRALSTGPAWIEERNAIYRERQQIILRGLQALGLEAVQACGSLYVWSRIPSGWASEAFALAVLQQTGVALAPGSFFGQRGEGYMRLSVTTPADCIQEAMERLVRSWDRILDRKPGL